MSPIPSKFVAHARASLRLIALIAWILGTIGPVTLLYYFGVDRFRANMVKYYYRVCCFLFGLHISIRGAIDSARPLLLVPNHTSYLDIVTIGGLVEVAFTPKHEIRSWPLIGFLAVLADCVFIERRPSHMAQAAAEMRAKLKRGKVLCIFGEGTTTDGVNIKPFKSGFFSLAMDEHLPVQPISLAYTHLGGRRVADDRRDEVAWVGDATFFDHFWHILSMPSVRIGIIIHPVIPAGTYHDRKALTQECERLVKHGVAQLMAEARN